MDQIDQWRKLSDFELGRSLLRFVHWTPTLGLETAISALVVFIVFGQIANRAGFSRLWSLSLMVPIVGSLVPLLFALAPWPVEKRSKPKRTGKRRPK